MIEITLTGIGVIITSILVVGIVLKIKRRKTAKNNLKSNGYFLEFI